MPVIAARAPSFAKYFRKECLHDIRVGPDPAFLALWWSGLKSRTRAGHPASQNLAENFMNLVKSSISIEPFLSMSRFFALSPHAVNC